MNGPLDISVVVPCWNVAKWLVRCLDDVLPSLPAASEVLAVDDGSTDRTLTILKARAARDPRIVVVESAHRGVSAARNLALDRARGRYVFFVDPDDGVEPDFFRAMVAELDRTAADLCVCAFKGASLKGDYRFAANAEIRAGYLPRIFGYSLADIRAWNRGRELFRDRELAGVWRMAFRREFLEAHRLRFDEQIELFEDAMFVASCLVHAQSMTCVNQPLYRVTDRASSASHAIPRDGRRLCRNKLALLAARERLDAQAGGQLTELYAGSCVFSALEILALTCRRRLPFGEGFACLRSYLSRPVVRAALARCPLSWRHPLMALAVLALRLGRWR